MLRNSDIKKPLIELIFEGMGKDAKHCLELFGSSEIILSFKNKCIVVTERHKLYHLSSLHEEADTKLILHAH